MTLSSYYGKTFALVEHVNKCHYREGLRQSHVEGTWAEMKEPVVDAFAARSRSLPQPGRPNSPLLWMLVAEGVQLPLSLKNFL